MRFFVESGMFFRLEKWKKVAKFNENVTGK